MTDIGLADKNSSLARIEHSIFKILSQLSLKKENQSTIIEIPPVELSRADMRKGVKSKYEKVYLINEKF